MILLLTAGLAGCLGGNGASGGDDTASQPGLPDADAPDGPGPASDEQATGLRFALDEPVSQVVWENGTFQITESDTHPLVNQAVFESPPDRREFDLTPLVPQNVPVVLTAEVNADLDQGDLDRWFQLPQDEVWASDSDTPEGGYSKVSHTILHTSSEPITLVLRYDAADHSTEIDYTLQYNVQASSDHLPAGVPVAVDVPEEATALRLEFDDEREDRAVLVWDPQDTFLGRFDPGDERVTLPLDEEAPRGEYVVLVTEGSGPARLSLLGTDEAPAPLRGLFQESVFGEPQEGQGDGSDPRARVLRPWSVAT